MQEDEGHNSGRCHGCCNHPDDRENLSTWYWASEWLLSATKCVSGGLLFHRKGKRSGQNFKQQRHPGVSHWELAMRDSISDAVMRNMCWKRMEWAEAQSLLLCTRYRFIWYNSPDTTQHLHRKTTESKTGASKSQRWDVGRRGAEDIHSCPNATDYFKLENE